MILLSAADVEALFPYEAAIPLMRAAMIAASAGRAEAPLRQFMPVRGRDGKLGLMPGFLAPDPDDPKADVFGVKIVSKFARAPGDPHGSHVGAVMLFAAETGLPLALIEGGALTAIRTAAMSAAAADALAQPEAESLLLMGAGEEAHRHAHAFGKVRRLKHIAIWARRAEAAAALAQRLEGELRRPVEAVADAERAVAAADIVCTVTSAAEPILKGAWLRPGQHVCLVGSAIPLTAEADEDVVARAAFFVDSRIAALAQAGELRRAIAAGAVGEDWIRAEIGEVIAGHARGRGAADEITLYKSLGVSAQDLAAASFLVAEAARLDVGRRFAF